jgi:hypothetical protein
MAATRPDKESNAIQQVAAAKGWAMWEIERNIGAGFRKRRIVSQRTLIPPQLAT